MLFYGVAQIRAPPTVNYPGSQENPMPVPKKRFDGVTVEVKKRPDGGVLIVARNSRQAVVHGRTVEPGSRRNIVRNEVLGIIGKSAVGGTEVTFERNSMSLVAKLFETQSDEVAIVINHPSLPAFPVTNDRIEIVAIRRSAESAA